MLLNVIGATATSPAQRMSLVVLLSEAGGTLRHFTYYSKLTSEKEETYPIDQKLAPMLNKKLTVPSR